VDILHNQARTKTNGTMGQAAGDYMVAAAAFVPYHFCDTQDSFQQKKSAKGKIE
jgi:hypothetical protein